jgi:hypothetical protein
MPRMTVYVPDTLWADVKAIKPDLSPSQSFQDALREVVRRERARPEHAKLTPALVAVRDEARRQVLEQATVAYQHGYELGLALAPDMHWEAFAALDDARWDWDQWSATLSSDEVDFRLWRAEEDDPGDNFGFESLSDVMSELREKLRLPESVERPSGPVKDGLIDAIRDVWEQSPAPNAPDTGGEPALTNGVDPADSAGGAVGPSAPERPADASETEGEGQG